jgi:hypothetical protein
MAGIEKRKARFEETPMTSLLCKMKLAVLARKMVRPLPSFFCPLLTHLSSLDRTTAPSEFTPFSTRRSSPSTLSSRSRKRRLPLVTSSALTRLER